MASASEDFLEEGVLNNMLLIDRRIAAGTLAAAVAMAGSGWIVQPALADNPTGQVAQRPTKTSTPVAAARVPAEKGPQPSKMDLTPESFATFRNLLRPADNEWRHLRIHWVTDGVAARKKAAQEDKPILIFRTGGAGYNDPLGVC
jgi:hypothetical protein